MVGRGVETIHRFQLSRILTMTSGVPDAQYLPPKPREPFTVTKRRKPAPDTVRFTNNGSEKLQFSKAPPAPKAAPEPAYPAGPERPGAAKGAALLALTAANTIFRALADSEEQQFRWQQQFKKDYDGPGVGQIMPRIIEHDKKMAEELKGATPQTMGKIEQGALIRRWDPASADFYYDYPRDEAELAQVGWDRASYEKTFGRRLGQTDSDAQIKMPVKMNQKPQIAPSGIFDTLRGRLGKKKMGGEKKPLMRQHRGGKMDPRHPDRPWAPVPYRAFGGNTTKGPLALPKPKFPTPFIEINTR